jgi:tripartite-type tricarboxylate transporter receptor subunit TctC
MTCCDKHLRELRATAAVRICLFLAVASIALLKPAVAEQFPTRIVRLVVPFPAGGGVDVLVRAISERLSRAWGQAVIVENRPGAGTMIGGEMVARSPPDGYTLLVTSDSTITSNPFLYKKQLLDPATALAPVTQLIDMAQMVVVHPSIPSSSLQQLVTLAKQGGLNYGSYGNGSSPNLLFESLKAKAGVDIVQVPFRGAAPAVVATLANDVQMTLGGAAIAGAHVTTGKLKALATGRKERLKSLPDVPTLKEAGFSDIDPRTWFGVFAPAGTQSDIVAKVRNDIASIINEPDFKERYIDSVGYSAVGSTPDAFAAFIKADLEYKRGLITLARIEPE